MVGLIRNNLPTLGFSLFYIHPNDPSTYICIEIVCNSILFVFLTDAKSIVPAEVSKDEISPYWSFNETADISKYEDFDHKKFLGKYNFIIIKYT